MTRALIVDDNEENRYYLTALLGGSGYEIVSAHDGADALMKARQSPPDVVISDLLMPVMDGYTLLRKWKADVALMQIPFVVYTATYTAPQDEQLALSLGADAFIIKPAEPEAFLARLQEVRVASASMVPAVAQRPAEHEDAVLREYNATLIRKLEQRTVQLEESNRALQRDIAARKQAELALRESEANFRVLSEALPQLVWITRADGWNIFFNQRWVDYTGLSLAESEGHGWKQPFHPDDLAQAELAWKEASESGGTYSTEVRLRGVDGLYRHWLIRGLPLRDATGAVAKWFGTCTDIEELKQSAAQLQQTEEQLRQAQKMEAVGRLAAGIAHDFNNLLTVILSYTALVLDDADIGERLRNGIEQVQQAGQRAAGLTRQLLAFSRQQVLEPKVLDLCRGIGEIAKLLPHLLGEDIEVSLAGVRPVHNVFADPSQIEQIVMNLAVNARDAMPRGGKLTIETANVELDAAYAARHPDVAPGSYVMIAVTDSGTGMSAATRERIFEPFFTTKQLGKGTGLGLSTVFGIVSQSNGHVDVYSEPGHGTTFKVYLPSTDRQPGTASDDAPLPAPVRGWETILLVEDDDQVRAINSTVLRRNGYNVIDAPHGEAALSVSEKLALPIHLLLTDVVMPRMNGRELAERLVPLRPEMKVLYVSGYTDGAIVDHVLESGMAFLQKPITPEILLRKVRALLSSA